MELASKGQLIDNPKTILRDPYVLEFIGLEKQQTYSESQLEQALIDHLQEFLHELGRDFCFMDRQHRITVAGQHYFLDLLFYHRKLRCLIAIDLLCCRTHNKSCVVIVVMWRLSDYLGYYLKFERNKRHISMPLKVSVKNPSSQYLHANVF